MVSRPLALAVIAGLAAISGCVGEAGDVGASNSSRSASGLPASDSEAVPDIEDLLTNERVLASYRREARDLVWARMCLPLAQLGYRPEMEQQARASAREFAERVGVTPASIDCNAA